MSNEELNTVVMKKPFEQFEIVAADGRRVLVDDPEFVFIYRTRVEVSQPRFKGTRSRRIGKTDSVPLSDIVRLEPIARTAAPQQN